MYFLADEFLERGYFSVLIAEPNMECAVLVGLVLYDPARRLLAVHINGGFPANVVPLLPIPRGANQTGCVTLPTQFCLVLVWVFFPLKRDFYTSASSTPTKHPG